MRTSRRNLLAAMETLEIDDRDPGPDVHNDIQMVYIVGDTTPAAAGGGGFVPGWGTPDPLRIEYGIERFEGLVVAEFTRFELLAVAGAGGLWLNSVSSSSSSSVDCEIFTIAALSGLGTRILPTAANASSYGAGLDATAIIDYGTTAAAAPASAQRLDISESATGRPEQLTGDGTTPIWIAPGRVFVCQLVAAGVSARFGCEWREIA